MSKTYSTVNTDNYIKEKNTKPEKKQEMWKEIGILDRVKFCIG